MTSAPTRLAADDLAELLDLIRGADSVEPKLNRAGKTRRALEYFSARLEK